MNTEHQSRRTILAVVLVAVFALAAVMGPGPGIYLVNPNPADPGARFFVLGMPVIYAWTVFWYMVQAGVVLAAYFTVWREPEPAAGQTSSPR